MGKREFFKLFWPAFQRAFTAKNVLSGWEKTGLLPFAPSRVLDQITKQRPSTSVSRPQSSKSSSSGLSAKDWRTVRAIVSDVVGDIFSKETHKLV